jgi:biopolymer transport protein ExbB
MSLSLFDIWSSMALPARVVAITLLVMGMASLTVFVERIIALRRSRAASKQFAGEVDADMNAGAVDRVIQIAANHPNGHLPRLVHSGLTTLAHVHPDGSGLTPLERMRRHLERRVEELVADLKRGLPVLASVGSVAPFVGLLGTVLGIISAFQGIASTGSGGLSSVSAGISEALVETALGLMVAIPAVLAFNYLSTDIARDELALTNAAGELVDTVEGWGEHSAVAEIPLGRAAS